MALPAPANTSDLYDLDHLERLANSNPGWGAIEVIDDALYFQPMTSELHSLLLAKLWLALHSARPDGWRVAFDTYIQLGPHRMTRPDVMAYRTDRPVERRAVPEIPALIIEVLSSDRDHDLVTKVALYRQADVARYIVIDPDGSDGWWIRDLLGGDRQGRAGEVFVLDLPGWPQVSLDLDTLLAD